MGARWAFHEDVVRLAAALRPALAVRGIPGAVYVDNGSAFVDSWLLRGCVVLGIRLVHSQPGRPLLTGQCLDHRPVVLPHVSGEPDQCRPGIARRVGLTVTGRNRLLMSHD